MDSHVLLLLTQPACHGTRSISSSIPWLRRIYWNQRMSRSGQVPSAIGFSMTFCSAFFPKDPHVRQRIHLLPILWRKNWCIDWADGLCSDVLWRLPGLLPADLYGNYAGSGLFNATNSLPARRRNPLKPAKIRARQRTLCTEITQGLQFPGKLRVLRSINLQLQLNFNNNKDLQCCTKSIRSNKMYLFFEKYVCLNLFSTVLSTIFVDKSRTPNRTTTYRYNECSVLDNFPILIVNNACLPGVL